VLLAITHFLRVRRTMCWFKLRPIHHFQIDFKFKSYTIVKKKVHKRDIIHWETQKFIFGKLAFNTFGPLNNIKNCKLCSVLFLNLYQLDLLPRCQRDKCTDAGRDIKIMETLRALNYKCIAKCCKYFKLKYIVLVIFIAKFVLNHLF